jgi:hypothetical protein
VKVTFQECGPALTSVATEVAAAPVALMLMLPEV